MEPGARRREARAQAPRPHQVAVAQPRSPRPRSSDPPAVRLMAEPRKLVAWACSAPTWRSLNRRGPYVRQDLFALARRARRNCSISWRVGRASGCCAQQVEGGLLLQSTTAVTPLRSNAQRSALQPRPRGRGLAGVRGQAIGGDGHDRRDPDDLHPDAAPPGRPAPCGPRAHAGAERRRPRRCTLSTPCHGPRRRHPREEGIARPDHARRWTRLDERLRIKRVGTLRRRTRRSGGQGREARLHATAWLLHARRLHQDNVVTRGAATHVVGSRTREDVRGGRPVVAKLRAAGAIVIGKTDDAGVSVQGRHRQLSDRRQPGSLGIGKTCGARREGGRGRGRGSAAAAAPRMRLDPHPRPPARFRPQAVVAAWSLTRPRRRDPDPRGADDAHRPRRRPDADGDGRTYEARPARCLQRRWMTWRPARWYGGCAWLCDAGYVVWTLRPGGATDVVAKVFASQSSRSTLEAVIPVREPGSSVLVISYGLLAGSAGESGELDGPGPRGAVKRERMA